MKIHYVVWAAQADQCFACGESGYAWELNLDEKLPEGVYTAGTEKSPVFYCRKPELVTCDSCLQAMEAS